MQLISLLAIAGLAEAALEFTRAGVSYKITKTDHGVEVPVKMGPKLDMISKRPQKTAKGSVSKRVDTQYTGNWCGMSNIHPQQGTWHEVFGGWIVPKLSLRAGQTNSQQPSIAQWVGIDGDDSCASGLIQGGTVSQIQSDGSQANYAWFEFVPDSLHSIDLAIRLGDTVYGNVTASSYNSGFVEIINASTGQAVNVAITNGPGNLCGYSAEWILEDLSGGGGLLPFAQFPSNSFFDCSTYTNGGYYVQAAGADQIDLVANDKVICTGALGSDAGSITITSTG